MKKVLAVIQAGGRSRRMGADKAWVNLAERPLIEYTLQAVQPLAQRIAIVISKDTPQRMRYEQLAAQWQAELLFDRNDYCGPLGGIQTALSHCLPNETALILACDLPFVTSDFLTLLSQHHFGQLTPGSTMPTITIPLDQAGRRQMLAGFYEPTCLPAVEGLLAEGKLRVAGLCARVAVQELAFPAYGHLSKAASLLNNLNTLEELQAAAFANDDPPLRS
jgi:molybdenum cofactor guanylyltransferase